MKKLYSHIAVLFLGISAGIFVAVKWLQIDKYVAYISKVKQKGRDNAQDVVFKPIFNTSEKSKAKPRLSKEERKKTRKTKREDKEQAKIRRRNQKKADKAIDRLEY